METKTLLSALVGFFVGGLLVSVAATTFDKPVSNANSTSAMSEMTDSLRGKTGDDYDKAFIAGMIEHHQSAVDMARLSSANAKHEEIKQLSNGIIAAQQSEIAQMQRWQMDWGYTANDRSMPGMNH